jgi:hypothetical protein
MVHFISSSSCATAEDTVMIAEKAYKRKWIFFISEMVFDRIGAFTNMKVNNIRGNGEFEADILSTGYLRGCWQTH